MSFPYAIALTGGISTGKSSVCALLKLHGFFIIDADTIAHVTLEEHHSELVTLFGDDVITHGRVDRKMIGKIIFQDPLKRKELEDLVHPLIREKILHTCQQRETFKKPYIVDIPLFFESYTYPIDKVIVVYAPQEVQTQRLMQRDGLSLQEAQLRLDAQISIEQKKQKATFIIDNSRDLKHLQNEVTALVTSIKDTYDC